MDSNVFRPYDENRIPLEQQLAGPQALVQPPYDPQRTGPFTRCRVLLLQSLESQAQLFLRSLYRTVDDPTARGTIAQLARAEGQQQLAVGSLVPAAQTVLQTTTYYEQLAVELAAALAALEPDLYARQLLEYALVEDLDHLDRFALLLYAHQGLDASEMTQGLAALAGRRPTPQQHLYPLDTLRRHDDKYTAATQTKLNFASIVPVEQEKHRYYKGQANLYGDTLARKLYAEIAEVEEQHITHYESLPDPTRTWLKSAGLNQVAEAYNYHSAWRSEEDPRLARLWERLCRMELEHIHVVASLLRRLEGEALRAMIPEEVPSPIILQPHHRHIREVARDQAGLRPFNKTFVPPENLPPTGPPTAMPHA